MQNAAWDAEMVEKMIPMENAKSLYIFILVLHLESRRQFERTTWRLVPCAVSPGMCRRMASLRSAAPAPRPSQRQAWDQWRVGGRWGALGLPPTGLVSRRASTRQDGSVAMIFVRPPPAAGGSV